MTTPDNTSSAQIPEIYAAMASIMEEIEPISKDKKGYQFNYRGIDDAYALIHPLLVKNQVLTIPFVENVMIAEGLTTLTVRYQFMSMKDGSSIDVVTVGQGKATDDKSSNKALSGAHKYAIFQVFCIPVAPEKGNKGLDDADDFQDPPEKKPPARETKPSSQYLQQGRRESSERGIIFDSIMKLTKAHIKNFGLTQEDIQALTGFATFQGLSIESLREAEKKLIEFGINHSTQGQETAA